MQEKGKKKDKEKGSLLSRILGWFVTIVMVASIAFAAYLFIQIKVAKRPSVFGYGIYTVISGSMEPTLHVGDVIIVKEVKSPDDLKKGDVITFFGKGDELEGKIVTHRIVSDGVEDGKITTCGDANHGVADKVPIEFSDVIGKLVKKSSFVTFTYSTFKSKSGFAMVIFIPLVILLVVQVVNFVKACKMPEKEEAKEEEKTEEELVKEKEEEIRKKAIEEYLAKQKEEEIRKKAIEEYLASQRSGAVKDSQDKKTE